MITDAVKPYLVAGVAALWVASVGGAAYLGYEYRQGKEAQDLVKKQAELIDKAIAAAGEDKAEALERARQEGAAAERSRLAKNAGVQDATLKARPDCGRDDVSLGLLNNAITAANTPASTRGMSFGLRGSPEAK